MWGTVRGPRGGRAAPGDQSGSERTEKLLRNARIRAKDKGSESLSMEPYPFAPPLKEYQDPIKKGRGPRATPGGGLAETGWSPIHGTRFSSPRMNFGESANGFC